jgi:hypothetical protein
VSSAFVKVSTNGTKLKLDDVLCASYYVLPFRVLRTGERERAREE